MSMRVDRSHTAGLSVAKKALKVAESVPEGLKLIGSLLSDSKKQTGDAETRLSNAEISAGAKFFWDMAAKESLKPAELAEVIRRLAAGEHVRDVLPQRFLPLD